MVGCLYKRIKRHTFGVCCKELGSSRRDIANTSSAWLEKSLANVTTETANWNVLQCSGSLESMGSDLDSISGLNNGSGDPPCAAPKCSELEETANPEV